MNFETFAQANLERCEAANGFDHKVTDWSLSDWMTATLGELGEAANVAKKLNRCRDGVKGNTVTEEELRNELRKEIGDVAVYLDLLAQSQGFSLEDAIREVFNAKSEQIGYPVKI